MNNGGEKPTFTPRSLKKQSISNPFKKFNPAPLGTPTFRPRSLNNTPISAPKDQSKFLGATVSQSLRYGAANNAASQATRQQPSFTPRPITTPVGASFNPRPLRNTISTSNVDSALPTPASSHTPLSFVQQNSISQPASQQPPPAFSIQNHGATPSQSEPPLAFSQQDRPSHSQQRFNPKPLHRPSNTTRQRLNPNSSTAPSFTPRPLASSAGNASNPPVFQPHTISNPSTARTFNPRPVSTPNFNPSQNTTASRPFRPKPIQSQPRPRNFNPRPLNLNSHTPTFTQPLPTATANSVAPMFIPKPISAPTSNTTAEVKTTSAPSFSPKPLSQPAPRTSTSSAVPTIQSVPFAMTNTNTSLMRPPPVTPSTSTLPMTSQPAAAKTKPPFTPRPLDQPAPSTSNSFAVPAVSSTPFMKANTAPKPLPAPGTGSCYSNMFWFLASHFAYSITNDYANPSHALGGCIACNQ